MTRITFEKVSIKRTFRWTDPVTRKSRQETKKFWQTVSPFNRNVHGDPKSRQQIREELESEARLWLLRRENDVRDAAQQMP
jgi:hypothetical protein